MSRVEQRIAVIEGGFSYREDDYQFYTFHELLQQTDADVVFASNGFQSNTGMSSYANSIGRSMGYAILSGQSNHARRHDLLFVKPQLQDEVSFREEAGVRTYKVTLPIGSLACHKVSHRNGMNNMATAIHCLSTNEADMHIGNLATDEEGWKHDVLQRADFITRIFRTKAQPTESTYGDPDVLSPGARYMPGIYGYSRFRDFASLGIEVGSGQLLSNMLYRERIGLSYSDVKVFGDETMNAIAVTFSRRTLT